MPDHRLRKRADFLLCYNAGQRFYSKQFIVFIRKRQDEDPWRFGLAVTRKTGNAVIRNRIKRVLREFFRLNGKKFACGYDLVVVPKRTLQQRCFTLPVATRELQPLFLTFFRQSGSNVKS